MLSRFEMARGYEANYSSEHDRLAADAFLWKVYEWMGLGLAITGGVAWAVAHVPALTQAVFGNQILFYILLFAPLGMTMFFVGITLFQASVKRTMTSLAAMNWMPTVVPAGALATAADVVLIGAPALRPSLPSLPFTESTQYRVEIFNYIYRMLISII